MTLPPDNALAASEEAMKIANWAVDHDSDCPRFLGGEGECSGTCVKEETALDVARKIDAALSAARKAAREECAKALAAAEKERDALARRCRDLAYAVTCCAGDELSQASDFLMPDELRAASSRSEEGKP